MRFNEKLIKLRKEKGLSQEELGEKLDVTRQTVSKWELGETTPEMSKLLEMANVFGVSIDELTNDNEIKEKSNTEKDDNSKRNVIIVLVLVAVLVGAVYLTMAKIMGEGFKIFKGVYNDAKGMYNDVKSEFDNNKSEFDALQNQIQGNSSGIIGSVADAVKNAQEEYDKEKIESEKRSFNSGLETWAGTRYNTVVQTVIDKVITSNQKNEKKITVKYNNKSAVDAAELRTLKRDFDKTGVKYEVYFEYDEEGFINQVIIEKI